MLTLKKILQLCFLEASFLVIILLFITGIRFLDQKNFNEIIEVYSYFAEFDTSTQLVLEDSF